MWGKETKKVEKKKKENMEKFFLSQLSYCSHYLCEAKKTTDFILAENFLPLCVTGYYWDKWLVCAIYCCAFELTPECTAGVTNQTFN